MVRTALVTGASSGIGAEFARRLAIDGFDLVVVARRRERLEDLQRSVAELGRSVEIISVDLSSQVGLDSVLERIHKGAIDMAVLSAGVAGYGPFAKRSLEEIAANWMLNATGPLLMTRSLLTYMENKGSGRIILVASALAFSAGMDEAYMPERAAYVAAKAALVGLGCRLNRETQGTGVKITTVCPGMVSTEWNEAASDNSFLMSAEDVVTASLKANVNDEAICFPGIGEKAIFEELSKQEASLVHANNVSTLAEHFRD